MAKRKVIPKVLGEDGSYNELVFQTSKTAERATYATYASEDTSKGTIEDRLTKLGFREDSVNLESGYNASTNRVTRQGNYVLLNLILTSGLSSGSTIVSGTGNYYGPEMTVGVIPQEFRPVGTTTYPVKISLNIAGSAPSITDASINAYIYSQARIYTNGEIRIQLVGRLKYNGGIRPAVNITYDSPIELKLGYEATPL